MSDLRYSRLQVFVSGQSNVSYRQKNQVLGADFSEGRNHFETFQGGLIMKLRDFRCFRLRVFIFGQSNILYIVHAEKSAPRSRFFEGGIILERFRCSKNVQTFCVHLDVNRNCKRLNATRT